MELQPQRLHENLEIDFQGEVNSEYHYALGVNYTLRIGDPRMMTNGEWQADISLSGITGRIFWGRAVLNSVSRRKEIVAQFVRRTGDKHYPIELALEVAFEHCLQLLRQQFSVSVYSYGLSKPIEYLLVPFLPSGMVTVLAGDGGCGKGYMSLALALSVASGQPLCNDWRVNREGSVVYIDYESSEEDIFRRLDLLINGADLDVIDLAQVYYLRAETPFVLGYRDYVAVIREREPALVILDSLAPAIGGGLEQSDLATELMRKLRMLNTTVLAISHVSKSMRGSEDATPYGSVFIQNLARNVWVQTRTAWTDTGLSIALTHTKSNVGRRHHTRHYEIEFRVDSVHLRTTTPPEHALSDSQRVYQALTRPMTVDEIQQATGLSRKRVLQVLAQLLADGAITRTGRGLRGDPHLYTKVERALPAHTHTASNEHGTP